MKLSAKVSFKSADADLGDFLNRKVSWAGRFEVIRGIMDGISVFGFEGMRGTESIVTRFFCYSNEPSGHRACTNGHLAAQEVRWTSVLRGPKWNVDLLIIGLIRETCYPKFYDC